eukprot:353120-Chlamydomonas_euryale.AAC.4
MRDVSADALDSSKEGERVGSTLLRIPTASNGPASQRSGHATTRRRTLHSRSKAPASARRAATSTRSAAAPKSPSRRSGGCKQSSAGSRGFGATANGKKRRSVRMRAHHSAVKMQWHGTEA